MATENNNELVLGELGTIQKRIAKSEIDSVPDRWEFGQLLRQERKGKQLPKGLRADITKRFNVESSEVTRRMQFAGKFETREEVVQACKNYTSWRQFIREVLVKSPGNDRVRPSWQKRATAQIGKLAEEARETDERRAALVKLLVDTLHVLDSAIGAEGES